MTKKNIFIKLLTLTVFFSILFFSGCFSHWHGDSAKIIISFTGSDRSAYDPIDSETHQKLEHNIVLANDTKILQFTLKGNKIFEAYVTPGRWKVTVNSWLDEDIYATSGIIEVDLKAGQDNRQTIAMYQAHLVRFESNGGSAVPDQIVRNGFLAEEPPPPVRNDNNFDGWYMNTDFDGQFYFTKEIFESFTLYAKWTGIEVPGINLTQQLSYLSSNAVDGGNYIVKVKNKEETISPNNLLGYNNKNVGITLTGGSVNLINNGSMFIIGSGVTLILEEVTLIGLGENNSSLVKVESGGNLIMNEGAKITGNKSNYGGGVENNGTFIMNGGDISYNEAQGDGGGVAVHNGGTFEMKGGSIHDNNTINYCGGGVVVAGNSKFIMTGGDINDNTANGGGGGVYINEGIFIMSDNGKIWLNKTKTQHQSGGGVLVSNGTFTMTGGEICENEADKGGGVTVAAWEDCKNQSFTMTGGKIYKNTATRVGGGVYVAVEFMYDNNGVLLGMPNESYSTFTMNGGKIYGNTVKEKKWNPNDNYDFFHGGGVFVWNATFNKEAYCTINGYDQSAPNDSNKITLSNDNVKTDPGQGHAVYVDRNIDLHLYRDTDVPSSEPLSYTPGSNPPYTNNWFQ